jgi:flagellin-like hook-associated protein FlgL
MRISTAFPQQYNINSMFNQQGNVNESQMKISSGKKYLSPAENPSAAAYSLGFKQSIGEATQHQENIDVAVQRLGLEETVLANVIDTIQRLQELGLQGVSDSGNSVVARNAIADEFDQLNEHLISLANTRNANGEYIFSGSKSTTMPFGIKASSLRVGEKTNIPVVTTLVIPTPATASVEVTPEPVAVTPAQVTPEPVITPVVNVQPTVLNAASGGAGVTEKYYNLTSGGGEFKVDYDMYGQADQMDIYVNNVLVQSTKGKVSGTGSFTITGDKLPAGSQVKVVVTGDLGTGWEFKTSYAGAIEETTAEASEKAVADAKAAADAQAAAEKAAADAQAAAEKAAADAKAAASSTTSFVYEGSSIQRVIQIAPVRTITDGDTGSSVFISPITGKSLFDTVRNYSAQLRADKPTLETLQELDTALVQVSTIISNIGARLNALDRQKATNEDFIINTKTALSQIEDLDYGEAITKLNAQQLSLQAAQQSYAKVQSTSLFNYLR